MGYPTDNRSHATDPIPSNPNLPPAPPTANEPQLMEPVGKPLKNGTIVQGRAVITVSAGNEANPTKLSKLQVIEADANGSTSVTYTNAASTNFTIDVTGLATLSDNNLAICGSNGKTKCTQAIIRVYTTGNISGFVNIADWSCWCSTSSKLHHSDDATRLGNTQLPNAVLHRYI